MSDTEKKTKPKTIKSTPVFIPYQLCPKCDGNKTMYVNQFDPFSSNLSCKWITCNICNGAGIIPMLMFDPELNKLFNF